MRILALILALLAFDQPRAAAGPKPARGSPPRKQIVVAAARAPRPLAALDDDCIDFRDAKRGADDFDIGDCRPQESGSIGEFDGQVYHYVLYCIAPNYQIEGGDGRCEERNNPRAVAIFVSEKGSPTARLLLERADKELTIRVFMEPEIITNSSGTFLCLNIRGDGTSDPNLSEYYRWSASSGAWQPIDFDEPALWRELDSRAPVGLTGTGCGLWPNLHAMTLDAHLQLPNASHCDGSAGTLHVKLRVRNHRFEAAPITLGPTRRSP
jgi:hypothetical protein